MYRGYRIRVTYREITLLDENQTAQFTSMKQARQFVRFLWRLAKEEGEVVDAAPSESPGRRKSVTDSDGGAASLTGGRSTRPPSSASRT